MNGLQMIWAQDLRGGIGYKGELPWHLKSDLQHFKALTLGKSVIMGRRTWDSLLVKPLPRRHNIILTTRPLDGAVPFTARPLEGVGSKNKSAVTKANSSIPQNTVSSKTTTETTVTTANNLREAVSGASQPVIIGGAKLYAEGMEYAEQLFVTQIYGEFAADVYAPTIDPALWHLQKGEMQQENGISFSFDQYLRR
jgi:dihydrofolate reductase